MGGVGERKGSKSIGDGNKFESKMALTNRPQMENSISPISTNNQVSRSTNVKIGPPPKPPDYANLGPTKWPKKLRF